MFIGLTIEPISSHWVCSSNAMCDWIVGKCLQFLILNSCSIVVVREPNGADEPWNCHIWTGGYWSNTNNNSLESSRFWLANKRDQEASNNMWQHCKMFPANTTSSRHKGWFMASGNSCLLLKDNEISNCINYSLLICLPAIHKSLADIWGWENFFTLSEKSGHD